MNKLEFKKQVLDKARQRQQEIIDDFRSRIEEIRSEVGNIHRDQYDLQQGANDESDINVIDGLADQIDFAVEEIDLLDRMKVADRQHDKVTIGSVVKTDKMTFFPSVSIEQFEVNGEELFGISTKAPLYELMKGKKAGDTVKYNGEEYKILEVF